MLRPIYRTKKEFTANDVNEGDRVVIRSGFGSEAPEIVTLEGVEFNGKNGRDTVNYTDNKGNGRWAYTDQIVRIITE
jgi:hydrogenase maturation factor